MRMGRSAPIKGDGFDWGRCDAGEVSSNEHTLETVHVGSNRAPPNNGSAHAPFLCQTRRGLQPRAIRSTDSTLRIGVLVERLRALEGSASLHDLNIRWQAGADISGNWDQCPVSKSAVSSQLSGGTDTPQMFRGSSSSIPQCSGFSGST